MSAATDAPPTMYSLDGWTDALPLLISESQKLPKWSLLSDPGVRGDEGLSSPEAMDPKTDSGCLNMVPLKELLKNKQVLRVGEATEQQLIDVMDALLCLESAFVHGTSILSTLFTFMHFFDLSLLDGHDGFKAFARSVIKHIHALIQIIASADVREGEEEFSVFTYEYDPLLRTTVEEIVAELDAAIAKTAEGPFRARLVFRRDYMTSVGQLTLLPGSAEAASAAVAAAQKSFAAVTRSSEVTFPENAFRSYAPLWLSVGSPLPKVSTVTWADTRDRTEKLLAHMAAVLAWRTQFTNMPDIAEGVKAFASERPSLFARSVAMLFLFEDSTGSVCGGDKVHDVLLKAMTTTFGAPLYELVFNNDKDALAKIAQSRIKARANLSPDAMAAAAVDAVRKWAMDVSRVWISVLHSLLHNRGRAHRRLVNLLPTLGMLQGQSWELDGFVFGRGVALPRDAQEAGRDFLAKSAVLSAVINEIVFDVLDTIVNLTVELGLVSPPELTALQFLRNSITTSRIDNYASLVVPVVPPAALKKVLPPAAYMRTVAEPLSFLGARLDVNRTMANAAYMLLAVIAGLEGVAPELSTGRPGSLQSVECVYNNRFIPFLQVQRPQFIPFRESMSQSKSFAASPLESLKQCGDVYRAMVKRLDGVIADPTILDKTIFLAAKKTCRVNLITVGMLEKEMQERDSTKASAAAAAATTPFLASHTLEVGASYHPAFVTATLRAKAH